MPEGRERRLGTYQLVAPLATGGMAELFIAKTTGVSGFEKQVALKVIHPNYSSDSDFVRMLIDEAKLTVQLQHANIVQTYDLGQVDGQYYIAMELIDGADLYKVLKTGSERGLDFPLDVAAHITAEVATGLDYAHRKNDQFGRALKIVHRDVSPQNVLISVEGEIKIVDFGIAKAALRDQQTQAGVIKGKYFYMSPEQAWGDKIDARTDVFSTGILLYEMLVGEMLYLEDDLDRLLKMVRAADIKPPSRKRPDVPSELDSIVMRALAKRPEDRFQSAADLATALMRFLRGNFPDSGRARVATFFREVLDREPSRAEITLPPPAVEDFADENSLIFDLKNQRRIAPKDARAISPPPSGDLRRGDQQTRGVPLPRPSQAANDYEEGGATEFDDQRGRLREPGTDPDPVPARARPSTRPPDFGHASEDSEPTEFARTSRPAPRVPAPNFANDADDEATSARLPRPVPAPPPPERPRRATGAPSPAPIAPRRSTLPPIASPAPSPRPNLGLGVSEPPQSQPPRPATRPAQRTPDPDARTEHRPASPAPAEPFPPQSPTTGSQSLVDWNSAPTVTPATATPYSPTSGDYQSLHSGLNNMPDTRRRKLVLVAGGVLLLSAIIVGVALVWPDGPARGSIEVVSVPSGASVRIDGTGLSKFTPIRIGDIDVRQPHHLAVSLKGYETWENEAKFESGEHELRVQAVLVPAVGTLDVSTTPPGAEAIVNGRISGITPAKVGDLPPNEDVTLELRLRGYKVVYRTLQWGGKRAMSVAVPLEKAH